MDPLLAEQHSKQVSEEQETKDGKVVERLRSQAAAFRFTAAPRQSWKNWQKAAELKQDMG